MRPVHSNYYLDVADTDLLALAERCARAAGDLLLERFRQPARGVEAKSTPTDLVSDADRDSESLLRGIIEKERPGDGLLGEEQAGVETSTGVTWVLDPLDATVNFLFRIPWWAVSVAGRDEEGEVVGAVFAPVLDEMFTARRSGGAFLNGKAIRVSDCSDLTQALVATGFAYDRRARERQGETVARVLPRVRDVRRMGSAALDLCALACGRVDGFYEGNLEEWDKAAGQLLISEAGGVATEIHPPLEHLPPGLVASNPVLHDELKGLVTDGHS